MGKGQGLVDGLLEGRGVKFKHTKKRVVRLACHISSQNKKKSGEEGDASGKEKGKSRVQKLQPVPRDSTHTWGETYPTTDQRKGWETMIPSVAQLPNEAEEETSGYRTRVTAKSSLMEIGNQKPYWGTMKKHSGQHWWKRKKPEELRPEKSK